MKFRNLLVVATATLALAGCGTASQHDQGQSSPGVSASAPVAGPGGQGAGPAAPAATLDTSNPACRLLRIQQMQDALGAPIAKFDGTEHKAGIATCYWLSAQGTGRFLTLGCPAAGNPTYETLLRTGVLLPIDGIPKAYSTNGKGTQLFAPTPNDCYLLISGLDPNEDVLARSIRTPFVQAWEAEANLKLQS